MNENLTIKELREALKTLGCTLQIRDGEYRVNIKGGSEATAYYTDDREDALDTARFMVESTKKV